MEQTNVTSGNPPEVATTSGGTSGAEAMAAALKAIKPIDGLAKAQAEAIARRNALYYVFEPLCKMPQTSDRSLIERQVQKAEAAYLAWHEAGVAAESCKLAVRRAEAELSSAHVALRQFVSTAEADEALKGDKTLAAAKYMLSLLDRRSTQAVEELTELQPAGELAAEDEASLAELRSAAVDMIATEVDIVARNAELQPLVGMISSGVGLSNVPLPVRPLEEEIIRYLSGLENALQRQQENNRKAQPKLKQRLTLIEKYGDWEQAWTQALDRARQKTALSVHCNGLAKTVEMIRSKSEKSYFQGHYSYDFGFCKDPGQLETNDRPTSTAVEKDQIAYLRKQMRIVAVNTAHKQEAAYALKQMGKNDVAVTPEGVEACENWQGCLAWYEELRAEREAAYMENLRRTTKIDLLQRTVAHFSGQETDEMTSLYKTFKAMVPRTGPLPSNELRKLIDMADWICQPLHASDDDR